MRPKVHLAALASASLLLATSVLLGAGARAQLLNTDLILGEDRTPTLRLAGGNTVADEAAALAGQVSRELEARTATLSAQQASLAKEITRLEAASIDNRSARRELALAQRLDAAYDREKELLERSKLLADKALATAKRAPDTPTGPMALDSLVDLVRKSQVARKQAIAAASAAEQTDELAEWSQPVTSTGGLSDRLRTQQRRVLAASASHGRAKALVAQAEAVQAALEVETGIAALRVTTGDIEEADQVVAAERQALERARGRWASDREREEKALAKIDEQSEPAARDAERELAFARLDLTDRLQEEAEASLALARIRLAVVQTLADRRRVVPAELDRAPLAVRETALSQLLQASDAKRTSLGPRIRSQDDRRVRTLLQQQDAVLGETLEVLERTRGSVSEAQILSTLTRRVVFGTPRPYSSGIAALLSVFFIGLMLLVWLWVHRRLMRWTNDGSRIVKALKLEPIGSTRLSIIVGVLWFAGVVAAAGATTIWGIWGLDMSASEAIRIVDYPLFFLDERGISAFSVIKFALALLVTILISRLLRRALANRVYPALKLDAGLTNALNTLIKYTFFTTGVLIGLYFVGIGLSSLALLAGVVGIGLGFGMRNIAENFISGLMILIERPVKIGDWIDIDGTIEGQVRSIRARSTTVVTRDNISVIIPNSEFISHRVTNWSHGDPRIRLNINIGVAYGSDTQLVRKVLLEVADAHGKILKKPAPQVHYVGFGASSLDFILQAWIDQQEMRERILSDVRFAVDAAFRRNDIEIPFPQRTLHIQSMAPEFASSVAGLMHPEAESDPVEAADPGTSDGKDGPAPLPRTAAAKRKLQEEQKADRKGKGKGDGKAPGADAGSGDAPSKDQPKPKLP